MSANKLVLLLIALSGLLLGSGCSSTKVSGSWTDDAFKGKPVGKMMIFGISDDSAARRIFEQQLVDRLRESGVDAISAYVVFQSDEKLEREVIVAKAREQGIDTLLVTKVARAKKESERRTEVVGDMAYGPSYYNRYWYDRPTYHRDWYDYYGHTWSDSYQVEKREYTIEYVILTLETNLYDLSTERLAWSAILESVYEGSIEQSTASISAALVRQMKRDGLIP